MVAVRCTSLSIGRSRLVAAPAGRPQERPGHCAGAPERGAPSERLSAASTHQCGESGKSDLTGKTTTGVFRGATAAAKDGHRECVLVRAKVGVCNHTARAHLSHQTTRHIEDKNTGMLQDANRGEAEPRAARGDSAESPSLQNSLRAQLRDARFATARRISAQRNSPCFRRFGGSSNCYPPIA
jgi:hypothetical protein